MTLSTDDRLNAVEARLASIERHLNLAGPVAPVRTVVAPRETPVEIDERKSGNWLGLVAVICFVLAAGFIVKLSIETGWLTPMRQLAIAGMLGGGLIWAGFALLRTDRAYASLLPATGIIVFHLITFAAYRIYGLVGFEVALGMVGIVSGLCLALYSQIRHDVYPITAAAGAYLAPMLINMQADNAFALYYFLLCSVVFAALSIYVRSRILTLVSAYLAILTTSLIGQRLDNNLLIACLLGAHFFAFAVGTYLYTLKNRTPLTQTEAWGFMPVLLLFYAAQYHFLSGYSQALAPWISLGFAALLIGLYLSAKRYFPENLGSQSLILSFATIVAFHSGYLELMPEDTKPWLFVIVMAGLALFARHLPQGTKGSPWRLPALAVLAILAIEYFHIITRIFGHDGLGIFFASFAAIWAVIIMSRGSWLGESRPENSLLACAHLLAIIGFWRLTVEAGSFVVSASWLFYALAVIAFAFTRKDAVMAKSALTVLAFAAGKALLFDASGAATVVRIFCLLLTGVVLYGCGLWMRRIERW